MKTKIILLAILVGLGFSLSAQNTTKRDRKKNLTVKEYKLKAGAKVPYLDDIVRYDANGNKVEEIEYTSNGSQKSRIVYE